MGYGSAGPGQAPGYGTPGYGTPGYGQYGQPVSGPPPGYGQPAAYGPPPPSGPAPQPGIVPLRPLGLGDIVAGAVRFIRGNPALTLGVTAAVMVVTGLVQLFVDLAFVGPGGAVRAPVAAMVGSLVSAAVAIVLSAGLSGVLLVAFSRAVLGQLVDVREAWRSAAPRVPGLIGLSLLIAFVIGAIVAFPIMFAFVVAAIGSARAIGVGALLVLGALAFVAYLVVRWALATTAYVLEPIGVTAALGRSWRLVRGSWWRVFGILLACTLVVAAVAVVVLGVFGVLTPEPQDASQIVRSAIATIVLGTVTTPFGTAVVGLLYLDQRIRRERLDLELARYAPPR
ncbi:MAG TPA: hypothetical protein VKZ81_20970 [Pseudonocardia sp.]|uniref:hypothetical protein n=1 Tax=Pseudonocardia sp. TaxID=60912 RepID=UPI002B4B3A46|nr:hypothetical protein [Pseudonocardia sp.]HLU57939.1 hypothetical protein [Pseudonocardia sp.]